MGKIIISTRQFLSVQHVILPAKDAPVQIAMIVINALQGIKKIWPVYLKTLSIAKSRVPVTLMKKIVNANVSTID